MERSAWAASAQAASVAGIAGVFLPSLDKLWRDDPRSVDARTLVHLRSGERMYVGLCAVVGAAYSASVGSPLPFFFSVGISLAVVATYEGALRTVIVNEKQEA